MKISFLVDNKSILQEKYMPEHGLSLFVEVDNQSILFDTGATDVYIQNAKKMGVDLKKVDYVVLSHGHYDHTGGLKFLANELDKNRKPKIISCCGLFTQRYDEES